MWRLFFVSLLHLYLQHGYCDVSNSYFKTEVSSIVEDMLKEYKLTTEHLQLEVSRLNSVVEDQQQKIATLEHKINVLTEKEETVAEAEHQSSDLEGKKRDVSSVADDQENESEYESNVKHEDNPGGILNFNKNIGAARNAIHVHEVTHINKRQVRENVAFCAYLDHDLTHLGIGHVIKYNKVLLNDGNGFNTHTGIFTAPSTGVYLFTFFFDSLYSKTEIRMVIDDVNVVGSVVGHEHGRYDLVGGNTAIIHVNKGQVVWTEPYFVGDQSVLSQETYRKTTFSGVLLYQNE